MSLTIADIERWDAGSVREVFHAAGSRAQAAHDAANGLATLPAFTTWGGEAAEAAKEAIGTTRRDLDAHGQEALAVANAARSAADEVERIKSALATLKADAAALGMEIDPQTGRVVAGAGLPADPMELLLKQRQLQPRVDALIADANTVDVSLANAIEMAGGATPIPESPHSNDPAVQAALNGAVPEDPQQFNTLWDTLTKEQKDWLYEQNPTIGNHPGMPWGSAEDVGKDHYNRIHLDELQAANQAELDRLAAQHPTWVDGSPGTPNPNPPGFREWKQQWDTANRQQQSYRQVDKALESSDGMPRLLGLLDDQGHAAVAINNPDDATRTATFVPGTGQDLTRLEFSTQKSEQMLYAALEADPSLAAGDVSVTTWMGYDRPMSILTDAPSTSHARDGAGALSDFQEGLRVTHHDGTAGGTSVNTVIGHSYGSTLMGAAGLDGNHLDANNVVAVGSPGILADNAGDLSLTPGARVFATRAENDIIGIATYATLGPDPMAAAFGATPFEAAPGPAGLFGTPTVDAHSSYWSAGNPALTNMGRIIAGQTNVTPPTFTP